MARDRGETSRTDAELAAAAMEALRSGADVHDDRIAIAVADGWVTLSGCAEHIVQRVMADCTARYVPGVRGVTNLLHIEEGSVHRNDRPAGASEGPGSVSAGPGGSANERGSSGGRSAVGRGGGYGTGMAIDGSASVD